MSLLNDRMNWIERLVYRDLRDDDWLLVNNAVAHMQSHEDLVDISEKELNVICGLVYRALKRLNHNLDKAPDDVGIQNYEDIRIENKYRKTTHSTWIIPSLVQSKRCIIMVHGWGSGRSSKSGHSMVDYLPGLLNLGDVVIFDQAGHGLASGYYTCGQLEYLDVLTILSEINIRKEYSEIVLMGFSAGCYPALVAFSKHVPISYCILDSYCTWETVYTSPDLHERIYHLPIELKDLTRKITQLLVPESSKPFYIPALSAEHRNKIILLYGSNDAYLGEKDRSKTFDLISPKYFFLIEDTSHVRSFFQARKRWFELIKTVIGE